MSDRKIDTEEGTALVMAARAELSKASGSLYTQRGWTMAEFELAARFVKYIEDAAESIAYDTPRADVAIARLRGEGVPAKQLQALGEGYQRFTADRTLRAAGVR